MSDHRDDTAPDEDPRLAAYLADYQGRVVDLLAVMEKTPRVEVWGEPEAECRPDGSILLRWRQDGVDQSPPMLLHDSVVRVLAAAILATR